MIQFGVLIGALLVIACVFVALIYTFLTVQSTARTKKEFIWLLIALLILFVLFIPVIRQGFL